jgi:rhamnose transport system permease protein
MTRTRIMSRDELLLLLILVVTMAVMGALNHTFFRTDNLLEMSRFFVETGLIALAMAPIMISGGIDLSVGSMVGLCVVAIGLVWKHFHVPPTTALAVSVLIGGLAGLGNGLFVAVVRVPALIVTLATMALYRGLALGLGASAPVSDFSSNYYDLGQSYYTVLGRVQIPQQFPIFIVLAVLAGAILHRTVFGRGVFAIGHNERAARLAGVPVAPIKLALYTASGILCGLAGAIFCSRVATAKADAGTLMELDVITVCVLGGVSTAGGRGSVLGAILGLLIVSSLVRGLTLARVPFEDQKIVLGVVLALAAIAYQVSASLAARAPRAVQAETAPPEA